MEEKWQHDLNTNDRDMIIKVIPAGRKELP